MRKIIFYFLFIFLFITVLLGYSQKDTKLYSRKVMELAEKLVSHDMTFSPTSASNIYANLATIYYESLEKTNDTKYATIQSILFLKEKYKNPEDIILIDRFLVSLNIDVSNNDFEKNYHYKNVADKNYWIITNSKIDSVDLPPKINSEKMNASIENSIKKTNFRTTEDNAMINFWSGMHMSPSISGIWQDRLYQVTKNYYISDKQYAYAQMILAKALDDTLKEVWITKAKFNNKRPSYYSDKLNLSMEDPDYSSYVSEYSATAVIASKILTRFFPNGSSIWEEDAKNASKIGILAGCSFDFDEQAGGNLAEEIFKDIEQKDLLKTISNNSFIPLEIFTKKVGIYERSY